MGVTVILGAQWGDEGKGKVVAYFSREADVVARFQGGANAGHTVIIGNKTFVFRLIPSGSLFAKNSVLGNGMVIDLELFLLEMENLQHIKKQSTFHVWISQRAHVVTPAHKEQESLHLHQKIGTTKMGIGPAYTDKVHRTGLRIIDIIENSPLLHQQPQSFQKIAKKFREKFADSCIDTSQFLQKKIAKQKKIIVEGAQGVLLDIDHGHYPFVTSSSTTIGGVCTGLGIAPQHIDEVYVVASAYQTKVGGGPFPTRFPKNSRLAAFLQQKGVEIDPVTQTLRDCGWLDLSLLKYAVSLTQPTGVILTKLDILSGIPELALGTQYTYQKKKLTSLPVLADDLNKVHVTYQKVKPWTQKLEDIRNKKNLPSEVLVYLRKIEHFIGCPVKGISVGPEISQFVEL